MKHSLFRFCDGRVVTGVLIDDVPLPQEAVSVKASFSEDEPPQEVPLRDLKAVFIQRPAEITSPEGGDPVSVSLDFFDGEKIRGTTRGWAPGRQSFLLIPDDASRIEAVLVIASSLVGVEVESGKKVE